MRNIIASNELDVVNNQKNKSYLSTSKRSSNSAENNPVSDFLTAEGCDNLLKYVDELGLSNDPNIIVLSSTRHYYYDADEMINVRTVINIKELNQIKDIKSFIQSIFQLLPQNSSFIGCFVDNKKVNGFELRNGSSSVQKKTDVIDLENGIVSSIPFINMIYSFIDSKTNKYLSAKSVSDILEEHGLKVLDMKVISGLTYFQAQKIGPAEK
jgi:hypothetical protein